MMMPGGHQKTKIKLKDNGGLFAELGYNVPSCT